MNKIMVCLLICTSLCFASGQLVYGQSVLAESKEELAIDLSEDEDYKGFILENKRYRELKKADAITEEEEETFHQKQLERTNNVKVRYPQLTQLSVKEAIDVRIIASRLILKKYRE